LSSPSPSPSLSSGTASSSAYLNGGTGGEEGQNWMNNLRRAGSKPSANSSTRNIPSSPLRKPAKDTNNNGTYTPKKINNSAKSGNNQTDNDTISGSPISPLFMKSAKASNASSMAFGPGRPSIGTMVAQWEFLKSNFVNSEEDLVNNAYLFYIVLISVECNISKLFLKIEYNRNG
jgi:hypothetical protein